MTSELSKAEILAKIESDARQFEYDYHGCGQCALMALQRNLNIGNDLTFKMASPLVAGIGAMGETCGALLGGVLAIGIIWGRENLADGPEATIPAIPPTRKFLRAFEKAFGSFKCWDIQQAKMGRSFNLADPDDYQAFQEAGGYDVASEVVSTAARMAGEIILDKLDKERGP